MSNHVSVADVRTRSLRQGGWVDDCSDMVAASEPAPDPRRAFRVVAITAAIVAAPFAIAGLAVPAFTLPSLAKMYAEMGGELPAITSLMVGLNRLGLLQLLMLAFDVAVFALMYKLAKRYWIGLLFAPVFVYMAVGGLMQLLLYLPMYQVITLVQ